LTFTGGANAGLAFDIALHTGSGTEAHLVLKGTTPFDVSPGDTFDATIGCPKLAKACQELFDNLLNFRGFPLTPGNDYAMQQVDPDDEYGNDGSSLLGPPDDTPSPETVANPAALNGGFFGEKFGGDA
jgi:uncharacterized phage protein (TIGR02218 family)